MERTFAIVAMLLLLGCMSGADTSSGRQSEEQSGVEASSADENLPPYIPIKVKARPTSGVNGYHLFCMREAELCEYVEPVKVFVTPDQLDEIEDIFLAFTEEFDYVDDQTLHNKRNLWRLTGNTGDCEEFAMRLKQILMAHGIPNSALFLILTELHYKTAKSEEDKLYHVDLALHTIGGDYVFSYTTSKFGIWYDMPYPILQAEYSLYRLWKKVDDSRFADIETAYAD